MAEFKADALLLRAADYRENDKMLTLLTAERGKLSAGIRGVRKSGAKLGFAAQPFSFAEYVLAERGGRYTVTQAALHESFFGLRGDLNRFYAGAAVTEAADLFSMEEMPAGDLLIAAVSALKDAETGDAPRALLAYYLRILTAAGYPVSASDCPICGKPIAGRLFFDLAIGAFTCAECARGVPASEVTYRTIGHLLTGEGESEEDGVKRGLRLMRAYIAYHTDARLVALGQLLGEL